jgi:hypothetical protein
MLHPFGLLLSFGEAVSVGVVGLGTAGLALFLGRRMFTRAAQPAEEENASPELESALPGTGPERRTSPRRSGSCVAAHLTDDTDQDPVEVWVMDRSLGGLCLLSEAPVAVGSKLRVRPRHASGRQLWTPVRVCACRRHREGWSVHCQFLHLPPMNVLLLFG